MHQIVVKNIEQLPRSYIGGIAISYLCKQSYIIEIWNDIIKIFENPKTIMQIEILSIGIDIVDMYYTFRCPNVLEA